MALDPVLFERREPPLVCYDATALPPIEDTPLTRATTAQLVLTSADGTGFAVHSAVPGRSRGVGVVVLPDNRGLSDFYAQLVQRLAEQGFAAVALDYYGRTAGISHAQRPHFADMAVLLPHLMKLTRETLHADITAGIEHLRSGGCTSVVSLGFCFGGRLAFQTAMPKFGLAAAIGFYGVTDPIGDAPGPTQLAAELQAPILGLFGGADEHIPASMVAAFEAALTAHGVPHEIVTYPGAPHGFFDTHQHEHAEAAADAWRRVLAVLRDVAGNSRPYFAT
ncbi:dienelactone hydrolase family protein [Saccharopolyspora thermophila]|uniref:dienelactone hydrolase family protein n=1 Tax=Saccharopolyspora thermophila TaxID=89367 RepID=UPI001E58D638|nr:dienelactone hydrolase family protein [Saccharopolyspora subtropica]